MTRIMGLAVLALLAVGCATNSSVKEQISPLADRISALEKQGADTNAKVADLAKKVELHISRLQLLEFPRERRLVHRQVDGTMAVQRRVQDRVRDRQ